MDFFFLPLLSWVFLRWKKDLSSHINSFIFLAHYCIEDTGWPTSIGQGLLNKLQFFTKEHILFLLWTSSQCQGLIIRFEYEAYFPSVFIHKDILWRFWMEGKPSLDWQKFSLKMKEEYGILSKIMEQNHYISALIFPSFNSCVSPSENRVWCQNYFFIQNFVSFENSCSLTTHLSTFLNFLSLTSQFNSVKLLFISHLIVKMKGTEWLVLFLSH